QHTVSTKITNATVYFDQARVTRQGTATVEAGTHRLLVGVEAFSMDPDSVTAEVWGDGQILGVQVARMPVADSPRQKIRELETRRDELKAKQQAVTDEKTTLKRQEAFLDSVADFSKTQVPREIQTQMPSLEDLDATRDFLGKQYTNVLSGLRKAQGSLDKLEKQIRQVNRELEMLRDRADKTASAIEILFDAKTAQTVDIAARYGVKNAGWSPVYRAMAADASQGLDLSMMAQVSQKTGEDWEDIDLSVSTAEPVQGGRLPELSPWFLDVPGPVARKSVRDTGARMEEMTMGAHAKSPAPMAEAEKHETALSFEYDLPLPVSVDSGEDENLLPLFTRSLESRFFHLAVPRRAPGAFLVCRAEADNELLAGPVQVFFEGRYAGRMSLGQQPAGQPFVLGLGADRSVAVRREKLRDHRKETRFFGKIERDTVVRELEYRIVAENRKQRPVTLHVRDSIPVSKTDRIAVKDVSLSPQPDQRDFADKAGVMQWEMELEPGRSREISISFTVTYPKNMPQPVF
ncbi:MAG: mucoidy inhibitor MuiA family protein, partial [Desulfobacterales bacterium]|nr:mucoidy inhibitor MuiA family protein [Desulfobacterales bacterium]